MDNSVIVVLAAILMILALTVRERLSDTVKDE